MNHNRSNADQKQTRQTTETNHNAGQVKTSRTIPRLARRTVLALAAITAVGLAFADTSLAAETNVEDQVWQDVDGGSLGAAATTDPDYGYCLADAGSLGIEHPDEVC